MSEKKVYDIAISFTEKYREVAETIATKLEQKGYEVYFYPSKIEDDIGTNMRERVPYIYQYESKRVIVLFSEDYFTKRWTQVEWEAIKIRAIKEKEEYGNQSKFLIPVMVEEFEHEEIDVDVVHYKWNGNVEQFIEEISSVLEAPKDNDKQSFSLNNNNSTIGNQFNGNTINNLKIS